MRRGIIQRILEIFKFNQMETYEIFEKLEFNKPRRSNQNHDVRLERRIDYRSDHCFLQR